MSAFSHTSPGKTVLVDVFLVDVQAEKARNAKRINGNRDEVIVTG
jgi:hypothetical protein